MAVTLNYVSLSGINFNMFEWDDSDATQGTYDITEFSSVQGALAYVLKTSIFYQMLAAGTNSLTLYDTNNQAIGSLSINGYTTEYVTRTYYSDNSYDEDYDANAYPDYRSSGVAGIKFKRAVDRNYGYIIFRITIDSNDYNYGMVRTGPYVVYDTFGVIANIGELWSFTHGADGTVLSVAYRSKTTGGVTHKYLGFANLKPYDENQPIGNAGNFYCYYVLSRTDALADNLNFSDVIITEDGYMDELENRFSARYWTNAVGMYLIPAGANNSELYAIADIMKMLQERKISDNIIQSWVGTDGKEYILRLRWYYGIKDQIQQTVGRYAMQIGPIVMTRSDAVPDSYYYSKIAVSEYVKVVTSELFVEPHYNNYLDMLTSYQLYLPYYGFLTLDPNDVVGAKLKVYYHINIFTGACNIVVTTKSNRTNNVEQKVYSVNCECGVDIPFTSDMYNNMGIIIGNRLKEAAGALSGTLKVDESETLNMDGSASYRRGQRVQTDPDTGEEIKYNHAPDIANAALQAISKQTTPSATPSRSGGTNQENGNMDELFPYLLITRPIDAAPSIYEDCVGSPSFYPANLGSITGFTKILAVDPSTAGTPPKYFKEILSLLQSGVYL